MIDSVKRNESSAWRRWNQTVKLEAGHQSNGTVSLWFLIGLAKLPRRKWRLNEREMMKWSTNWNRVRVGYWTGELHGSGGVHSRPVRRAGWITAASRGGPRWLRPPGEGSPATTSTRRSGHLYGSSAAHHRSGAVLHRGPQRIRLFSFPSSNHFKNINLKYEALWNSRVPECHLVPMKVDHLNNININEERFRVLSRILGIWKESQIDPALWQVSWISEDPWMELVLRYSIPSRTLVHVIAVNWITAGLTRDYCRRNNSVWVNTCQFNLIHLDLGPFVRTDNERFISYHYPSNRPTQLFISFFSFLYWYSLFHSLMFVCVCVCLRVSPCVRLCMSLCVLGFFFVVVIVIADWIDASQPRH